MSPSTPVACVSWVAACLLVVSVACAETLYVSPTGRDTWSGRLAAPNAARTDGPLATLTGARDAIRALKAGGALKEAVRVVVAEGTYGIREPFVLEPQDSGTAECPITYTGIAGKRAILSGGRRVTGWRKQGDRWVTEIPEVRAGQWYFSELWVNGERRTLARMPNEGFFHTTGKSPPVVDPATGKPISTANRGFRFRPGDIKSWANLDDVAVIVYQSWETSTHRIQSVDEEKHSVLFRNAAPWAFEYWEPKVRYYVENVPEALDAPGEWYLDRRTGVLSYIPLPGEDVSKAVVTAPVVNQLVLFQGKPAEGQFVGNVHIENLRLLHTEWTLPAGGHSAGQAACDMPAAIEATGARNCAIEGCEIGHLGAYGVWLHFGTQGFRVAHNDIHDLGAGGVRLGEMGDPKTEPEAAARNVVDNDFIHDGGKTDPGAVGVWIGRTSYNTVSHNEICDLNYTGISVGWSWGYDPTSAHDNIVELNHIHDIGRGMLGDMGGIYCLGVSPGTVIRNNVVHDVYDHHTGSLAIYTDEGSTGITIENNIGYNTLYANFHQHYGRENIVRNNIWAFGRGSQLSRARQEDHISFTFERNIILFDNGNLLKGGWTNGQFVMDNNLFWDTSHPKGDIAFGDLTFAQWQAQGHDAHSLIADPLFVNAAKRDFRLKPDSPALKLGFVPIDATKAGLYGDKDWVNAPKRIKRTPYVVPPPAPAPKAEPIAEDFEELWVGAQPEGAYCNQESDAANVAVTDETWAPKMAGAAGETPAPRGHSLKFQDAAGQQSSFNPHMFYTPNFTDGVVVESFDVRVDRGAIGHFEWRDNGNPYRVGPSVRIEASGETPEARMLSNGREIDHVPVGKWVHLEITCGLGTKATGLWSLKYGEVGGALTELQDLPCDPKLKELRWLGFVADAQVAAAMYVDNVRLGAK